jgi:phenylpropionate dioxygenase-like ring-hydroxylating dioxygenase large terminal subunit
MQMLSDLVRPDEGLIDRSIFSSEAIYRQELEQIFARCWLFLAHESQIPRPGDFFSTWMGEDPVLVVRQRDGSVAAFLNSCRHRGMRVCRADLGNARAFTCTYHGWTYGGDGRLINVPHLDDGYLGALDLDASGLVRVPRLEVYNGLIFGSFDPAARDFCDYLGDFRWYFDATFDRLPGGTEVVGGVHKWVIPANWKFAAEQFTSDMYHAAISHASAFIAMKIEQDEDDTSSPPAPAFSGTGLQFTSKLGHGAGFFVEGPARDRARKTMGGVMEQYYDDQWPAMLDRLGEERMRGPLTGHANLFPSFSFLPSRNSIRVWHPRGPDKMEVWSWVLVDKAMPPDVREAQRLGTIRTFSPSGMLEQDDGENWGEIQRVLRGAVQARTPFNYSMGIGSERDDLADYPGTLSNVMSEGAARSFYRRYVELMDDSSAQS